MSLLDRVQYGLANLFERIQVRTRKGLGQEEIDKLREFLQSDKFKQLNDNEKADLGNQFIKKGNYKEFLDNPDIIAEIFLSISSTTWESNEIEINKKVFPYFMNGLKKQMEKISGNYENEKLQSLISRTIQTMKIFNIPDLDKLKYIEDNFEDLSQNSLFLACLYNYFTVYKQFQMGDNLFKGKNIEERFNELNKRVSSSIKNSSLAKSIAWKSFQRRVPDFVSIAKDNPELQEKIETLRNLSRNYALDFLNNKKVIETLSIEQLTRLSLDNKIIVNLEFITRDEKGLVFIQTLLTRSNVTEELPDFLRNLNNYLDLFRNVSIQDLQNSQYIEQILDVIIQDKNNGFDVKSLEDIKSYSQIRTKKCLEILSANTSETSLTDELTEKTSLNTITQKREALYYLFFGLSGLQVENLVNKYCKDVFEPEILTDSMNIKDAKTLEIMRSLRRLYEAKDINEISRKVLEDKELIERLKKEDIKINYASLETSMIEFYNNRFNEVLYNPTQTPVQREVIYKGQPSRVPTNFFVDLFMRNKNNYKIGNFKGKIATEVGLFGRNKAYLFPDDSAKNRRVKIYEVDPKKPFNMFARVEGAYFGYQEPYDFSRDKQFDLTYHGNCKSFIANDLLALARVRENSGPIFGYSEGEKQSLLMMAPYDLGSNTLNQSFAPHRFNWDEHSTGIQFRAPKFMKDSTRHNHNEVVYDRLQYDESKKDFKRDRPQYIIYIKEFDQNTIIENQRWKELARQYGVPINTPKQQRLEILVDLSKKTGEPLEEIIYDDKYRQSIKAAAQFDIPLVIIDRNKVIQNEFEKFNKSIEEFKQSQDPVKLNQMLPELITTFENNAVSCRFISNEMFGEAARKTLHTTIINKINTLGNMGKDLEKNFIDALITEKRKYMTNRGINLRGKIPKAIQTELKMIDKGKSDEFSRVELPKMIQEISKTDFYEGNKNHSIEHIQKVMILADEIASARNLPVEVKKLIAVAAAFHDSGRGKNKDGNDMHGIASAQKIKEYFEANPDNPFGITEDNLPILQAAIEYHEVNDKDKAKAKLELRKIAKKYGVDYRKNFTLLYNENNSIPENTLLKEIANDLKDADALDRFRFAYGGRLNPEYLRTEQAKSLIEFANVLNAKYATKVLEDIYHAPPEILEIQGKVLALRFFRKRKCEENPDYIEPHIDVDTLLKDVYGYSLQNSTLEQHTSENKIKFAERRNLSNYEDLTPTYVNRFLQKVSRVANYIRGKKIEEEEVNL